MCDNKVAPIVYKDYFGATKDDLLKACASWCLEASMTDAKGLALPVLHVKFLAPREGKIPLDYTDQKGATIWWTEFQVHRQSWKGCWPIYKPLFAASTPTVVYRMSFTVRPSWAASLHHKMFFLPSSSTHRKTLDDIVAKHTGTNGVISDYDPLYKDIKALPMETQKAIFLEQFKQCGLYICRHGIKLYNT